MQIDQRDPKELKVLPKKNTELFGYHEKDEREEPLSKDDEDLPARADRD
jgi:hypothetical protein